MTPSRIRRLPALVALACALVGSAVFADEPVQRELAVCADPSNLPFSNDRQEGFENRIASLIAADLKATLRYTWNMQRRGFLRRTLNTGSCDVVLGVPAGLKGVLETRAFWASSYVFVTRRDRGLDLHGFDDPALARLRIGLHALGSDGANTPPAAALARRGLTGKVVGYPMWAEEDVESPPARAIDAVASGEVDVAIVWGPFAGYFAKRHGEQLVIAPVDADPQQPELAFSYAMAIGVRKGDAAFRDELQAVLDRRRADIDAILREFGVPPAAIHVAEGLPLVARRAD